MRDIIFSEFTRSTAQTSLAYESSPKLSPQNWFAIFTVPRHEKAVEKHLQSREIEAFLPTFEQTKIWKNRQKARVILPLFPSYLFVHVEHHEHSRVLQSPGVLAIVGNGRGPVPLPDSEIEFLRVGLSNRSIEPYPELAVGQKVRIKSGLMQGFEGLLVRKKNGLRFVLTLSLINQQAAIEVGAEELEPLAA